MSGIKVLIDTKDYDGQPIDGYGFIMRRLNAQAYEIWVEALQTVMVLHPDDFKETDEDGNI
jgi:hypothetical protein